jgi:hypothetical protein
MERGIVALLTLHTSLDNALLDLPSITWHPDAINALNYGSAHEEWCHVT